MGVLTSWRWRSVDVGTGERTVAGYDSTLTIKARCTYHFGTNRIRDWTPEIRGSINTPRFETLQKTRNHILQLVQSRQGETVAGLARELGLAPATVRRHMDILQRDGLLTYEEVRHGTGRPEHLFSLTDSGHEELPKNYDALLSELVSEMASLSEEETSGRSGEELVEFAFANVARRAAEPYIKEKGSDPIEALHQLLTDHDFAPEFEVMESGIRITLNNCPFRSAVKDNPTICSFDTGLISGVLKSEARREACIRNGDQCCSYVVADVRIPVGGRS